MPKYEDIKVVSADKTESLGAPLPASVGKFTYKDNAGNIQVLATENYVNNIIPFLAPCLLATTQDLGATYDNGTDGVGATLTGSTNEVLSADGETPAVNTRILVKNQTTEFQNGIYVVADTGSASTAFVLMRATDYDSPSQMIQGGIVSVILGTENALSSFMQQNVVAQVGTDAVSFSKLFLQAIHGTTNQIAVDNTDPQNPVLSIPANPVLPGNVKIDTTGYLVMPVGNTAQQDPDAPAGSLRFNTDL